MAKGAQSPTIFKGTDERIHSFLGLSDGKTWKQKSACRGLTSAPKDMSSFRMVVSDLYDLITENRSDHTPSLENWRIKRQLSISPKNSSPEILLERAIARLGEREDRLGKRGEFKEWFNQVPVASGLINDKADKRAAIDLLRCQEGRAEFVELKWKSDTPVFAAFEILLYGLAYLYSRVNRKTLGYLKKPLMSVSEVSLRVLAPRAYYADYDLNWLGEGLDEAVRTLAAKKTDGALSMGFSFLAFPPDFAPNFEIPFKTGQEVRRISGLPKDVEVCPFLVSAMRNLEPVFRSGGREHS